MTDHTTPAAEVRALRETVARLNRRSQVAEAAIADLTREPIGGRKHKPVAAEVWTRCEESHGRGCRTTREAREEAERLRAEVERLRSEMAAKTADSALLLGFLGGAYDERDGARDGLVDLTARLAEQTRLTEQAREWAVRWQGEAERLRAGIESEIARRDETASRQEQAQLGSARRAWFDRLADQGRPGLMGWEGVVLSAAAFLRRVENDPAVQDAMLAALVRAGRLREQRKSSTQMRRCDGGIACAVTSGQATIGANPPPGAGYTHYHIDVPIGRRARLVTEWREVAE